MGKEHFQLSHDLFAYLGYHQPNVGSGYSCVEKLELDIDPKEKEFMKDAMEAAKDEKGEC